MKYRRAGRIVTVLGMALPLLLSGRATAGAQGAPPSPSFDLERRALELARDFGMHLRFDEPIQALAPARLPAGGPALPESEPILDTARAFSPDELAAIALRRNPALAEARAGLAAALADLSYARSARLPRIDGTISASALGNPMDAVSIPAGAFGTVPIILPPEEVVLLDEQGPRWYQFKATLTQPLFTWGRIDSGIALAKSGSKIASINVEKAERDILLRLGATLDGLAIMKRLDEALRLQASVGERLVFISEQSLKAGFITSEELFKARIDVKELDLARAELSRRQAGLLQELRGLCGLPELDFENLSVPTPSAGRSRVDLKDLALAARSGSLDLALVAALQEAKALNLRMREASRSLKPSFALRAELAYEGEAFPLLEKDWSEVDDWQVTVSIASTLSLFDAGASHASSARALAELGVAQAQAERARSDLESFVQGTIRTLELDRARLEYDGLRLQSHEETLGRLRSELQAGTGTESEYLRGQLDALSTVSEAWTRLLEHRSSLWALEGVLAPP